jgi:hypothetical protein
MQISYSKAVKPRVKSRGKSKSYVQIGTSYNQKSNSRQGNAKEKKKMDRFAYKHQVPRFTDGQIVPVRCGCRAILSSPQTFSAMERSISALGIKSSLFSSTPKNWQRALATTREKIFDYFT